MIQTMVEAVALQLGRVAERERAARSLADAHEAAVAASRGKSEFLATMSHEIRTPLNGIIGLNDLLLRSTLQPEQLRLSSGVQVASRALLGVINDVLDFSTIEAGRLELKQVDFEVRPLLDQVPQTLAASALEAGVELVMTCHPDVPEVVTGDPARLYQVLVNLVSNAVKFTVSGEVLVLVTGSRDGDVVPLRVEVRDTGIGIEPAQVPRLFEPFTQADTSSTRRFGGTGLGLAISREIVGALGGELTYEPNPGGGSVFRFEVELGVPQITPEPLDEYARTWLAGRRILVVDDNARRRMLLEDQATRWRMRPTGATGAEEGLERLRQSFHDGDPFEAVLIALTTTGRDGLALATDIAADSSLDEVTMVMLSEESDVDMPRVREAGVSVCLNRPVPVEVLRGTLLEQVAGVAAQPLEPSRGDIRHRRRVLVVEDNPVNQLVATGLLESLGYLVDVVGDGAQALEVLRAAAYDGVLMDVQMPVLDGYATTRAIREQETGARLPVIAMTAAAVDGERERCVDAGMDDFLTKPVDPVALATALDRWLGREHEPAEEQPEEAEPLPATPPIEGLDTARLDMLRDLDPGDTTYLDRAIDNFQRNSVEAVEAIRSHLLTGDLTALKAAAHKIAGSALNLGARRAGTSARALELAADTGSAQAAGILLAGLDETMGQARSLLRVYQATYTDSHVD